jgi:hypothetical protein
MVGMIYSVTDMPWKLLLCGIDIEQLRIGKGKKTEEFGRATVI